MLSGCCGTVEDLGRAVDKDQMHVLGFALVFTPFPGRAVRHPRNGQADGVGPPFQKLADIERWYMSLDDIAVHRGGVARYHSRRQPAVDLVLSQCGRIDVLYFNRKTR